MSRPAHWAETPGDRAARGRARLARALLAARRCPCDPTRGQSCRYCDGTDADDRELALAARDRRRKAEAEHRAALHEMLAEATR